jgi:hypothetical protein
MSNLDKCSEITQYDGHEVYQSAKHNALIGPCHGSVNQTQCINWAVPWLNQTHCITLDRAMAQSNTLHYFGPCHGSIKHTALLWAVPWLSQPNTLHYFGPCHGSVSQTHCITSGRAMAQSAKHNALNGPCHGSIKRTALLWAVPWLSQPNTLHYFGPCHGSVSQTQAINLGRAMALVLSCDVLKWRPVKSPGIECRICGGQGDTRPGRFSLFSTIPPCSITTHPCHWLTVTKRMSWATAATWPFVHMFHLKNYKTNFEQICSCANCINTTITGPL